MPTFAASSVRTCPFCEGIYRPIVTVCPPGTIVDSAPPAPIASAHLDVAMNCTALATQCVQLALAATADDTLPRLCAGPSGQAALGQPLVVVPHARRQHRRLGAE